MHASLSIRRPTSIPRLIPLLLVVLGVQLALTAVLALRRDPVAASTPQTPLVGQAAESADHIVIAATTTDTAGADAATAATQAKAGGAGSDHGATQSLELVKRNGEWVLPQYFDAPARATQVTTALSQIAAAKRGLPVGTSAAALKRFHLVDDQFERRVQLSRAGKAVTTIYLGSSSGVHKSYARTLKDRAAYSVELAGYELPMKPVDWLDTEVAARGLGDLSEIDVTAGSGKSLQLRHTAAPATAAPSAARAAASGPTKSSAPAPAAPGGTTAAAHGSGAAAPVAWTAPGLEPGNELDASKADALAHEIASLRVQSVLGTRAAPEWRQDHPDLVLVMKPAHGSAASVTWTLAKPSTGEDYVLKSSQYPWYFQIDALSGKQLIDGGARTALLKAHSGH